jgi:cyclophilin family peptidyl-prolyl cis-trans isomerase
VFSRLAVTTAVVLSSLASALATGPYVQFRTPVGDIEVELYDDKPVTTQNFLRYVQNGLYKDMFLHRWVPGFVIQGGGFLVANRGATNALFASIPSVFGRITNEFNVGRHASNVLGTIAMAKTPDSPDSATSQWFFNLSDNAPKLDTQNGGFTVFGHVVRGLDVLRRFNNLSPTNGLYWRQLNPPLNELPVLSDNPDFDDLVYCDITLLNVQVRVLDGAREISWNSVNGVTNRVEFTTGFPPAWQELSAMNGTGERLSVTDTSPAAASRFYRVRVDF